MYGSSLTRVTFKPRASRIAANDAAAIPLPNEETTPPVTNTNLVIYLENSNLTDATRMSHPNQRYKLTEFINSLNENLCSTLF
jgi:hypothetical protein